MTFGRRLPAFLFVLPPALLALCLVPWRTSRESTTPVPLRELERAVVRDYAALVHANYQDAVAGARALAAAVDRLLASPDSTTLREARQAWVKARIPYAQTEAFRFYDGPIESAEGLINAWPIDENLVDYVEGDPQAGIINHPERFGEITPALLTALNEKEGEKNITAGFHAIEFLLWGQDLDDEGAGRRPPSDYRDGTSLATDRRRAYLRIASRLLVGHLDGVTAQWAPDRAGNYRTRFLALPPEDAIASILKGIGILSGSELAGERLTVAYETKEQEDEHSCFSDNTQQDMLYDAIGIRNVYTGRYDGEAGAAVAGLGMAAIVQRVDPQLARTLEQQIEQTVAAARRVPVPFDRAIRGADDAPGRIAVKALIGGLRAQADSIARVGAVLGVQLNF